MKVENVLGLFTNLISKAEGSRQKQINLGSSEMTFYRGEIHMIWAIARNPGIHSSEIARQFGVTRVATAKIIAKLEKRGFLRKQEDHSDKKKIRLFLTSKGEMASAAHYEHHKKLDEPLITYMENLSEEQRKILGEFLVFANDLMDNHS